MTTDADARWIHHTIQLDHPQGCTVEAAVDWETATITVDDPSDVAPAEAWIEYRRTCHRDSAARTGRTTPFPAWTVEIRP